MYASKYCNVSNFMAQVKQDALSLAAGSRGWDGLDGLRWTYHCSSCLQIRGALSIAVSLSAAPDSGLTHLLRQCCWTEAAVRELRVILCPPHFLNTLFVLIAQHHVRTLIGHFDTAEWQAKSNIDFTYLHILIQKCSIAAKQHISTIAAKQHSNTPRRLREITVQLYSQLDGRTVGGDVLQPPFCGV